MIRYCPWVGRWVHPNAGAWSDVPLIFLDLDETLVYTKHKACEGYEHFSLRVSDGSVRTCHVRPHALRFLRFLVSRVRRGEAMLGVWSTGETRYVQDIVSTLFRMAKVPVQSLSMVVTRDATPRVGGTWIKMLEYVAYTNTLLLDDNALHAQHFGNQGRVRLVKPFRCDDPQDRHLVTLMRDLDRKFGWAFLKGA